MLPATTRCPHSHGEGPSLGIGYRSLCILTKDRISAKSKAGFPKKTVGLGSDENTSSTARMRIPKLDGRETSSRDLASSRRWSSARLCVTKRLTIEIHDRAARSQQQLRQIFEACDQACTQNTRLGSFWLERSSCRSSFERFIGSCLLCGKSGEARYRCGDLLGHRRRVG